jgi:iron-sulfur cluster assembly protein
LLKQFVLIERKLSKNSMEILKELAPIKITTTAQEALEQFAREEGAKGGEKFLRIGVKSGGCAGFSYILAFEEKEENDITYQIGNLELITDKDQLKYIQGLTIDYETGLNNRGFIYINPNANTTCGCGTSFG